MGALHEDVSTFMVLPRWFLLRIRNISNLLRKSKHTL